MKNYWLQRRNNQIVQFHESAEFLIWGQKTLERNPTDPQIDCFLKDLVKILDSHSREELKGMDFKPLYAKYPRVRICIRRALYVADSMPKLEEKQCPESN